MREWWQIVFADAELPGECWLSGKYRTQQRARFGEHDYRRRLAKRRARPLYRIHVKLKEGKA